MCEVFRLFRLLLPRCNWSRAFINGQAGVVVAIVVVAVVLLLPLAGATTIIVTIKKPLGVISLRITQTKNQNRKRKRENIARLFRLERNENINRHSRRQGEMGREAQRVLGAVLIRSNWFRSRHWLVALRHFNVLPCCIWEKVNILKGQNGIPFLERTCNNNKYNIKYTSSKYNRGTTKGGTTTTTTTK